jgi:hypothetical protein
MGDLVRTRVGLAVVGIWMSGVAFAGPQAKITSISPKYPTGEIEITWETALTGGCTTSSLALTHPGASNHQTLVASLLPALSVNATVEVIFGGGCNSSNTNWIQTIKLLRP